MAHFSVERTGLVIIIVQLWQWSKPYCLLPFSPSYALQFKEWTYKFGKQCTYSGAKRRQRRSSQYTIMSSCTDALLKYSASVETGNRNSTVHDLLSYPSMPQANSLEDLLDPNYECLRHLPHQNSSATASVDIHEASSTPREKPNGGYGALAIRNTWLNQRSLVSPIRGDMVVS